MPLKIRPVTEAVGAEIDVDLRTIDAAVFSELKEIGRAHV